MKWVDADGAVDAFVGASLAPLASFPSSSFPFFFGGMSRRWWRAPTMTQRNDALDSRFGRTSVHLRNRPRWAPLRISKFANDSCAFENLPRLWNILHMQIDIRTPRLSNQRLLFKNVENQNAENFEQTFSSVNLNAEDGRSHHDASRYQRTRRDTQRTYSCRRPDHQSVSPHPRRFFPSRRGSVARFRRHVQDDREGCAASSRARVSELPGNLTRPPPGNAPRGPSPRIPEPRTRVPQIDRLMNLRSHRDPDPLPSSAGASVAPRAGPPRVAGPPMRCAFNSIFSRPRRPPLGSPRGVRATRRARG